MRESYGSHKADLSSTVYSWKLDFWDSQSYRLHRACYSKYILSSRIKLASPQGCCHPVLLHDGTGISKLLQLCATFTNSLSWVLFRESNPNTWCQALDALYDPFTPSTPIPSGRFIHYQVWLPAQSIGLALWTTTSLCWPWGNTSENISLDDVGSFLFTADGLAPSEQHQLSQLSKCFISWVLSLANHKQIHSTSANQNYRFSTQNCDWPRKSI